MLTPGLTEILELKGNDVVSGDETSRKQQVAPVLLPPPVHDRDLNARPPLSAAKVI